MIRFGHGGLCLQDIRQKRRLQPVLVLRNTQILTSDVLGQTADAQQLLGLLQLAEFGIDVDQDFAFSFQQSVARLLGSLLLRLILPL